MTPRMQRDARAYRTTLLTIWALLLAFAAIYSIQQNIPARIVVPFVAAALVEIAFYLAPGFAATRTAIESVEPPAFRALVIEATALIPYLIYSLGTGTFHWRSLTMLAVITSAAAVWYVLNTEQHLYADLLFLALFAAVVLLKVFPRIYVELASKAPAAILGQLMWIRLCILAVLSIRTMGGIGFGFLPTRKDWRIGIQQFLLFGPVAVVIGMAIGFARPHLAFTVWWKGVLLVIGTFAGFLWVVGLMEEFFVRGMLQQLLTRRFKSTVAGLILASVIFGLAHLPFRQFPNWRFAIMAGIAGVFYGLAYIRAGSVRAAMVTHALVVTTWRVFFA